MKLYTVIRAAAAVVGAAVLVGATSAAGDAATPHVRFGAKLDSTIQPSNAFQPYSCASITGHGGGCTRVSLEAYRRPGAGTRAPKTGTIHKIRIIAGTAGSFIPEIARVRLKSDRSASSSRIVSKGHTLHYKGQGGQDGDTYKIETFSVNLKVRKGDFLAIQSSSTSILRCSDGGTQQLVYQPTLKVGSSKYHRTNFHDGCFLLMEAQY